VFSVRKVKDYLVSSTVVPGAPISGSALVVSKSKATSHFVALTLLYKALDRAATQFSAVLSTLPVSRDSGRGPAPQLPVTMEQSDEWSFLGDAVDWEDLLEDPMLPTLMEDSPLDMEVPTYLLSGQVPAQHPCRPVSSTFMHPDSPDSLF